MQTSDLWVASCADTAQPKHALDIRHSSQSERLQRDWEEMGPNGIRLWPGHVCLQPCHSIRLCDCDQSGHTGLIAGNKQEDLERTVHRLNTHIWTSKRIRRLTVTQSSSHTERVLLHFQSCAPKTAFYNHRVDLVINPSSGFSSTCFPKQSKKEFIYNMRAKIANRRISSSLLHLCGSCSLSVWPTHECDAPQAASPGLCDLGLSYRLKELEWE